MYTEYIEVNVFKYIADKEYEREVEVDYNDHGKTINATTQEYINAFMEYGYEVNNDRLPTLENKPSARGDTYQPVYK